MIRRPSICPVDKNTITKNTTGGKRKQKESKPTKGQKGKNIGKRCGTNVPITPQMIRDAVKALQTRRAFISSSLIGHHLRKSYPVQNDPKALKSELHEKLHCAVIVGLIVRCGEDKYCLPTLRQQANTNKTAISAFWERYYNIMGTYDGGRYITYTLPNVRIHTKQDTMDSSSESESNDHESGAIGS
ncbi:uncharacterized protein LOC105699594 [Orussus abietinus]|uniref:uncharacterized protein LOC105699594 n=1 Tax=Orussus abietinus TaxID=222816 RepID=UPI000C71633D|nr:uncharacterized protein LOC105699594 [Orussus abietinus]